jgi:arylsulfatase
VPVSGAWAIGVLVGVRLIFTGRSVIVDFIERAHAQGNPFYLWWNGTRMHFRTHVKPELRGISGQDEYGDGMVEHDRHVGQLIDKLDELGSTSKTR